MSFDLTSATREFMCRPRIRGHSEPHVYPSEASAIGVGANGEPKLFGGCLRSSYLRMIGEQGSPHSERSQAIFRLGSAVEDLLVEEWKLMGVYLANSIRFKNPKYNVSGELDAILQDPETGRPFGVEVKSFYGYKATKEIFGNQSTAGAPKDNNLLQTCVYAWEFRETLDHFKIFYEDRGDGSKRHFDLRIDRKSVV